jgi:hypothetical protein
LAVTMLAVQISKQRASRPALEELRAEVRTVAPAALPALGFLPSDADLIAGVHIAEINEDAAAREFLKGISLGAGDADLSIITKWTGLRLQDVDHAVLGLRVQGQLIPRFTMVVRTLRPFDAETLRKSLKGSRLPARDKKDLYKVEPEKSPLRPLLWFIDDRTLAVGLKEEDLELVPAKPRDGIEHLRPEITAVLKERLVAGTPFWITGRPENWGLQLEFVFARWRQQGQPVEIFQRVRTFGVWFQFTDGLALNAAFECADAASAGALDAYLTGRELGDKKPFSMPAPRPELDPIYNELGRSVKSERNEAWLTVQAKASAETLRQAFTPK